MAVAFIENAAIYEDKGLSCGIYVNRCSYFP
jgi:hypothetical protein